MWGIVELLHAQHIQSYTNHIYVSDKIREKMVGAK